ncbi:FdhF/YdeP family oxidoreductase [Yinghuangia sp. ASG 101]|uniref:FdhF/YdeP family oxidoreductase n=1 Tax=Yinghuangia sp. ASG 101 TaxID=2896848 RepID=UPI001E51EC4F|nr:FdhF/YdeP family oxidoreductase [Yinghuangia sp. ASG 101]UGQ10319.1 FdhF/YdeP family oxidoreductase [Yinghuangia sp. ASG 101]
MVKKAPVGDADDSGMTVGAPKRYAAGIPAIVSTLRHTGRQMGVRRGARTLLKVNQKDGFDCPGCAWPEGEHRSPIGEYCENGAKAVAEEATLRRVTPEFFAAHPVAGLAGRTDYWLGQQGRLTHPMYLAEGAAHYVPVTWDEAFGIIADELGALDSPDEAAFYTSGRTSNEAAFAYQLFVRAFGTNNLPDCSNMCHESSGSALTETIGIGKGSVSLEDLHRADLILVVGQNPGTNHPRMLSALEKAKRAGAHIVAVNPLPEAGLMRFKNPQRPNGIAGRGTALADEYAQIRVNGDLALFRALNRLLLEADEESARAAAPASGPASEAAAGPAARGTVIDHAFVDEHCGGFEEFAADVRATPWADVLAATGLPREQIERIHERVLGSRRVVVCWAMGLTQHRNSVATIREVVNFLLLRGNIGRPGAGVCPVRGHSNVQGDRTMGIHEKPSKAFLDALEAEFGFAPPRAHGHDVVDAIRAMRDGRVKVFMAVGGNFVSATPDTAATEEALRRTSLTVQVSTKLNRSHAVTGRRALILPCLGRTEADVQATGTQFVTVEDSMSAVHASTGTLPPASRELRSEVAIVCGLAERVLGDRTTVPWRAFREDYDLIRDRVARVVPGFADFNARVRAPGGFVLPHGPRDERRFPTATGKANFTVNPLDVLRVPPGRLILQTVRSHDQYNTTIYGLDDRYRGVKAGRRVVFVHPADLAELGIADGEAVDLVSEWTDGVERRAPGFRVVAYPTARECAAAYFPETNVLVPLDSTAEVSNTPTSKSVIVRLEPTSA